MPLNSVSSVRKWAAAAADVAIYCADGSASSSSCLLDNRFQPVSATQAIFNQDLRTTIARHIVSSPILQKRAFSNVGRQNSSRATEGCGLHSAPRQTFN